MIRHGLALAPDLRPRLRVVLAAALLAVLACAAIAVLRNGTTGASGTTAAGSELPAGLQAAIDHTLAAQPVSSPGGVSLRWGARGAVSFAARHDAGARAVIRPLSIGRSGSPGSGVFSPGSFVFGSSGTAERLGAGVSVAYRTTALGFEQRFRLARRVGGSGELALSEGLSGGLRAVSAGRGAVRLVGAGGPVLTYGGLRVTDASGRVLRSRLQVRSGGLRIVIDDRHATYPLTVDPSIVVWTSTPAASLTDPSGTSGEDLGWSVAVSADGQTAVVGAPYAGSGGAVLVYTQSGGSWSAATTLAAGSGGELLGFSVAVSADGQTIVAGAPYAGSDDAGAVSVYTQSGGSWSTTPTTTPLAAGSGGERLGWSVAVSADGQTIVAGAPYAGAGSYDGAVFVYTQSGGSWSTTPTTATFTGSGGENLGYSVAVSADGQTIVAGTPGAGSGGAVLVYTQSGGSWSNTPTTATFSGSATKLLGFSVAVSADGQTVVAGAPSAGSDDAGAVSVYTQSGGSWSTTPTTTLTGSGGELLGYSVAVSADGQTIVAGAPNAGSGDGAVSVYTQSGGSWSTTPTTATFTGSVGEQLGDSVAVSADGQTIVAGAPSAGSDDAGAVSVYTQPGRSWSSTPAASLTDPSGTSDENLGYSVAVSADGQTAVVGAPYAGGDDGAVLVYTQSGGSWSNTPTTATFSGSATELLGFSVAVSADGQTIVAGAPYAGSGGAVLVYTQSGGSWSTTPTTATFTGSGGESLGYSVAVSADGQTIVAGTPGAGAGDDAGAVSVYTQSGGSWSTTPTTTTFTGSGTEQLGSSVAISADGQTIVAGAPYAGSYDGAVFVYTQSGGSWSTTPTTATFTGSGGENLGYSVAVSADGQTIVAGAPSAGSGDGAVSVYTQSGGSWSTTPTTATFTGSVGESLGYSVAVSADGQTVVAGAPSAGSDDAGAVSVYTQSGGSWSTTPTTTLTGSGGEQLGFSVAVSADGQTIVAGAPYAGTSGGTTGPGGASVYELLYTTTTAAVENQSVTYSPSAQSLTLGTTVTAPGGETVTEGQVLFTIQDGSGDTVGTPTSATVGGDGSASASYTLPKGTTAGSYTVDAAYSDPADGFASSSDDAGTLTVGQATDTITFPAPSSPVTAGTSASLSATGGGSGQPVELTVDAMGTAPADACSVTQTGPGAGTVDYEHVGTCVIDANQAGNADYSAASPVSRTVTVQASSSTVSVPASLDVSYGGSVSVTASVSESSGLAASGSVQFELDGTDVGAPVTVAVGKAASPNLNAGGTLAVGPHTVTAAFIPTDDTVQAAGSGDTSLTVGALAQAITFTPLSSAATAGSSAPLSATGGGSGEPVRFTVDTAGTSPADACSVTQTGPGAGTVSYEHAGTCVIDADQAASAGGGYSAATRVSQTVQVQAAASSVSVATPPAIVYGQAASVTATVSEANGQAASGSVQFELDGSDVGSPVTLTGGKASSPSLNPAGTLTPGAHKVTASFAPADQTVDAAASATVTQTVDQAPSATRLRVSAHALTATVSAVAPGAGTPGGQVRFSVDGRSVGSAGLSGGTATLSYTVRTGATRRVAAAYGGDSDFTGSSASSSRSDPTLVAHVTSRASRSRYGWYRTPVTVRFSCVTHGAPLTAPCPAAVTLSRNGAGQSVTRTITATDGGAATAVVRGIEIDRVPPRLGLTGARDHRLYLAAPHPRCIAHDTLSGIAACTIQLHSSTAHGGLQVTTVHYTLRASDRAGNASTLHGSYRIAGIYLQGAAYAHGSFTVEPDRVYTLVVNHAPATPRYIDAAPAPNNPAGDDNYLHPAGHGGWAIGVLIPPIPSSQRWYLGVQAGGHLHELPIREP